MLAAALRTRLRLASTPTLVVAGRTDAGVHARGQVAHVDVRQSVWDDAPAHLVARLRGLLPHDLRVTAVTVAPVGFHARYSATWRRYTYSLADGPGGADPLRRDVVVHRRPLDVDAMNEAAQLLVGEHDFRAFCRPRPGVSTVRNLRELRWQRTDDLVVSSVRADAFCHHMVRALVGALVAVGEGRRPADWPATVLRTARHDPMVKVMPPHGLVLEEVGYPAPDELPVRVELVRRLRDAGH